MLAQTIVLSHLKLLTSLVIHLQSTGVVCTFSAAQEREDTTSNSTPTSTTTSPTNHTTTYA